MEQKTKKQAQPPQALETGAGERQGKNEQQQRQYVYQFGFKKRIQAVVKYFQGELAGGDGARGQPVAHRTG